MSLASIDDLRDINKKIEERNDDVEEAISAIEEVVKKKEEYIDEVEATAKTLASSFAKYSIDVNDKLMRETLETLLGSIERWVKKYDKVIARADAGSDFAKIAEVVCPGLVDRLKCLVEEYDDLAENIRLSLEHSKDLAELEMLAEDFSVRAQPMDMDKWS